MKNLKLRVPVYLLGLFIMTVGVALSVKSNLGVSPVSSIPYTMTRVWGIEMGNATIIFHCALVFIQFLILRKKILAADSASDSGRNHLRKVHDVLQLSRLVFSNSGQYDFASRAFARKLLYRGVRDFLVRSCEPDSARRRRLHGRDFRNRKNRIRLHNGLDFLRSLPDCTQKLQERGR